MPIILSNTIQPLAYNSQRRLFIRNNLYYLIYKNGFEYFYTFSPTVIGLAESTRYLFYTSLSNSSGNFDIYYDIGDDNLIFLVYGENYKVYFIRYSFDENNLLIHMSTSTVQGISTVSVMDFLHITKTSDNYWAVSYLAGTGNKSHTYRRSTNIEGTTWTAVASYSQGTFNFRDNTLISRVGLVGNTFICIGVIHTTNVIVARYFNGTGIDSDISSGFIRSTTDRQSMWSGPVCDSLGNVHIVACESGTNHLYELIFDATTLSWSQRLVSSSEAYLSPTLGIDSDNNCHVLTYIEVSLNTFELRYFKFENGSWVDKSYTFSGEFANQYISMGSTSMYERVEGDIFFSWTSINNVWVNDLEISISSESDSSLSISSLESESSYSSTSISSLSMSSESDSSLSISSLSSELSSSFCGSDFLIDSINNSHDIFNLNNIINIEKDDIIYSATMCEKDVNS